MEKFEKMLNYLDLVDVRSGVYNFDDVIEYVKYITDEEEVYKNYDDNTYLKEFIKDLVICATRDERLDELKHYADILYLLYKDEF